MKTGPRIYNLFPSLVGSIEDWEHHLERIAAMGFDWVYVNPFHETGYSGSLYAVKDYYKLNPLFRGNSKKPDDELLAGFVEAAGAHGISVMMDLVVNHTARDAIVAERHPAWYRHEPGGEIASPFATDPADPSQKTVWTDLAEIDYSERPGRDEVVAYFSMVARHYASLGFSFRCDAAYKVPPAVWAEVIGAVRAARPQAVFAAETLGGPLEAALALAPAGFDYLFNSSKWWDFRAGWLLEQYERFRHIAPSIAFPESHDTPRLVSELAGRAASEIETEYRFRYLFAAFFSAGVMMPIGYEYGFERALDVVLTRPEHWEAPRFDISGFVADVNAMKRASPALNEEGAERAIEGERDAVALVRYAESDHSYAVALINPDTSRATEISPARILPALNGGGPPRDVTPQSRAGRLEPDRPIALRPLEIRVFAGPDGPRVDGADQRADARPVVIEDVWPEIDSGRFAVKRIVGERVVVEADVFREGHDPVEAVLKYRESRTPRWSETPMSPLGNDRWRGAFVVERNGRYRYTIEGWPASERARSTVYPRELEAIVDRAAAQVGAWYEMFPRSYGTFAQARQRLPEVRAMEFDVVYLPPVHPIGRSFRKGRNNSLEAGPDDPGSPWAIGNADGGHTAVDPSLGTIDDFVRFVDDARAHDLEVALDFAVQCSPDHPYVREHPEWFTWRPDGTIQYAENPPKKYQDIVNFKWYGPHAPALWDELLGVVEFWIARGVRIFRVDNPHTKPFAFWEWLIREVQSRRPDVVFLSEAFTRPKVMKELAKRGFSQSYTYFTWRNFKSELTDYLEELAHSAMAEYFRPNFFANTPDILPPFLQTGGRPAFRIRLVLAATLSSSYGIYSGFELCEADAIAGTEEYANSEKYEIKVRDWDAPGNIKADVARINRIRRENPALHDWRNLRFAEADDENVLFYVKRRGENALLIAVNLDPFHAHEATLHFPLADLGLGPSDPLECEELLGGEHLFVLDGRHRVRLDPERNPAAIYRATTRLNVDYRSPSD